MKMILVFKTSVCTQANIVRAGNLLNGILQRNERWNFDLEDCDRILRVEAVYTKAAKIEEQFEQAGFTCVELPD